MNNLLSILLNTLEDEYTWHKKVHYHSTGSNGLLEWTVTTLELRILAHADKKKNNIK
jgi:hypothetical protein